jgi:hypothetical protein
MPWKECWVMDERLKFVARRLAGTFWTSINEMSGDAYPGSNGHSESCRWCAREFCTVSPTLQNQNGFVSALRMRSP